MIDPDIWRVLGNVARGNDPRDAQEESRPIWGALFPWLPVARLLAPLAAFILFCLLF